MLRSAAITQGFQRSPNRAMLAIARMNIPVIFVYGGTIKPGKLGGCDLTLYAACIDAELDSQQRIVPGLGDAEASLFGTLPGR